MTNYKYRVGGTVPANDPTYIKRQADSDLEESLKNGEFCYVLNSRQTGKSSLRVQIMQQLQAEEFVCAAIDISSIGTSDITPEQWYAGVIDSIVNSLNLYDTFNLGDWWNKQSHLDPVKRFSKFIQEVLLQEITQNIVIFVDEIDSVRRLNFPVEDFFAVIRECYNNRADRPDYCRLTFVLIGVATPSDLIQNKKRTPFNIGRAIELTGFQLEEARPLAKGLEGKASNPETVLKEVLHWTGGQPFLTQKVCKLIKDDSEAVPDGREAEWVENLVQAKVIENWESQDEQTHLRTIRDRILENKQLAGSILLYRQILQEEKIYANDNNENLVQAELMLSGLVVKHNKELKVYSLIYKYVFNNHWVEYELSKLRPYAKEMIFWFNSGRKDSSYLLLGRKLKDAEKWVDDQNQNQNIAVDDYRFILACKERNNKIGDHYKSKQTAWSNGRDKNILLCGEELQEAIEWASGEQLDDEEDDFLSYSIAGNLSGVEMLSESEKQGFIETITNFKKNLGQKTSRHYAVIEQVLRWTNRDPFLSKKVCQLILDSESSIPLNAEETQVEKIVRTGLIEGEDMEVTEHKKKISDRLFDSKCDLFWLLWNYRKILKDDQPVAADGSLEQNELLDFKLVVNTEEGLKVSNLIYQEIMFSQNWVDRELTSLRPYAWNLIDWLDSDRQDPSQLLRGEKLQEAMNWIDNHGNDKVNKIEDEFIIYSITEQ